MLDADERPYCRRLSYDDYHLVLRTAASEEDVERVAAFNSDVHGEEVDPTTTRNLFLHHPATRGRDLFFVTDEESGQVVSSLCLIPWTWRYGGVEIPAGELGIVGTAEPYRRRGLVRAQVETFKARLRQRGCLLSQIQGIPYFYRQFGYTYALPLERGLRLELRHVPASPELSFTFRRATPEDVPTLQRLYDEAVQALTIHTVRNAGTWRYLETYAEGTITERERWIVESAEGRVVGYVSVQRYPFGEELAVDETSDLGFEAALAALQHLKRLAVEREKPGLRLNLPLGSTLARLALSLHAYDTGTYAWQIHVPDVAALLQALAPLLERRLADSAFAGWTRAVRLDLYRETLDLRFEAGRLTRVGRVEPGAAAGEVVLRCPPLQFIPLVLGYRTWRELRATYPDVIVPPIWRLLVDVLFPRVSSFLYTSY